MEFLAAVFIYITFCLIAGVFYQFRHCFIVRSVARLAWAGASFVQRCVPVSVRRSIERLVFWFLFERHCLYQVLYVVLILVGHAILITEVIARLYRLSTLENHLFIGLASLFCNGLCYLLVCLADPGVITPRNLPIFANVYPYDGVVYTARQCNRCLHQMPARSKHCARCDQCVFRFDHHCVWTNCCIGGQNHAHFLCFLASLLIMVVNATWLSFRMLHDYTVLEGLWRAQYLDAENQLHPMDWSTLIQHLFMIFPRVVSMAFVLACLSVGLSLYFVHHLRLLCINQTTYEYDQLGKHMARSCDGQSVRINPARRSVSSTQRPRFNSWFYSRGLWANWSEVFGFQTTNSLRELRRRLPVQMEFKTH